MKTAHRIVGILWMAICAYFFATLVQGIYEARPDRLDTLAIHLFFVLLYLAGAVTSFYVLAGARWARIVLSVVALLTVTASLMGLFAFFNSHPYSLVGIAFDIFALASAGVLLFVPKYLLWVVCSLVLFVPCWFIPWLGKGDTTFAAMLRCFRAGLPMTDLPFFILVYGVPAFAIGWVVQALLVSFRHKSEIKTVT